MSDPICRADGPSQDKSAETGDVVQKEVADSIAVEHNDSVRVTELEELVVKSRSRWFENGKLICIPSRQEKNLSDSPASLIDQLMLPGFKIQGSAVTDPSGRSVKFFINGKPADKLDVAAFSTKNVKRVEYLSNPVDPKFQGAESVINFIVQEYEVGGVTKISAQQTFPNLGFYNLASKLNYKSMEYAVLFSPYYVTSRESRPSTGSEEYRDFYYNGRHYDSASREYANRQQSKISSYDLAANARYNGKKLTVKHYAAVKWERTPEKSSSFTERWSPALFDSYGYDTWENGKGISANVLGTYEYTFDDRWYAGVALSYTHGHTGTHSGFRQWGIDDSVSNDITENTNSYGWTAMTIFKPSPKWSLRLKWDGEFDNLDVFYGGSTSQTSRTRVLNNVVNLPVTFRPRENFSFYINPGLNIYRSAEKGGRSFTDINPDYDMYFNWTVNSKVSLSLFHYMQNRSPWASYISEAMIRTAPLLWTTGSPDLKNYQTLSTSLDVSWIPAEWCSISGSVHHLLDNNQPEYEYVTASPELGGLVRKAINGGRKNSLYVSSVVTFRMFNKSVSLTMNPQFNHESSSSPTPNHLNAFQIYASLRYRIGNCEFSASYSSPQKYLAAAGTKVVRKDDRFNLGFSYGTGNLFVSVSANDLFYKFLRTHEVYRSGNLSDISDNYSRGRNVGISVSYTLSYGKKVKPSINIKGMSGTRSAVVGSSD